MGEKVLYLDSIILPLKSNGKIDVDGDMFCGGFWKEFFLIEGQLKVAIGDGLPQSSRVFINELRRYTRSKGAPTSITVDEVVLFEIVIICLPVEQGLEPFKWRVTGSAGIGS